MIFNGIAKIDDHGGDYIVLGDYGLEGLSIVHQAQTAENALCWMTRNNYVQQTLVKMVRIEALDADLRRDLAEKEASRG